MAFREYARSRLKSRPKFFNFGLLDFGAPGPSDFEKSHARSVRLHPRMEITRDGLMLGAGTILTKMARDGRGASIFAFDEPRVLSLLTTAYEKPVGPRVLRQDWARVRAMERGRKDACAYPPSACWFAAMR
jgi:hypothetical protein